ncbi:MAG TPA: hypothetical protein VK831_04480 [Candidatus Deferrimicrobiaceae bacterium]|nr:hypothetical protein [Candidatus Deferrimicrobiaceae bacterium]
MTQAIGYCGRDRSRRPLRGHEIRGCWEGRPAAVETVAPVRPSPPRARLREFVPLDDASPPVDPPDPPSPTVVSSRTPIDLRDRVTLFDLEA